MSAFWIILTGSLVAASCGLLGCFLILRRMAMIGDAISHAVLPGIVIAYIFTHSLDSLPMILGATSVGLLATFLIELVHQKGKVQADAAIGLIFTFLFSCGVILISSWTKHIDLDADCVLHGEIAMVPFELWITESGLNLGPIAVWKLSILFLIVVGLIYVGYRPLRLTTFDPQYAAAIGVSTGFWHYLLMGAVSMTTVLSFESVGAILVVAFLVAPPAIAYLLTERLDHMLLISLLAGLISAVGGYALAAALEGAIAGAMTAVLGIEFIFAYCYYVYLRK